MLVAGMSKLCWNTCPERLMCCVGEAVCAVLDLVNTMHSPRRFEASAGTPYSSLARVQLCLAEACSVPSRKCTGEMT